jgi:sulfatase maturation enzyme AslB (radical SAM superfamily)
VSDRTGLQASPALQKFQDPDWTVSGEERARVPLTRLETLWINTGTLCNITCANCYIESSPTNDRLVYIRADEVAALLDEIARDKLGTQVIAFTGGEPFMNPQFLDMLRDTLQRGFEALVLTNAMQPMQRPRMQEGLADLVRLYGAKLTVRVSLDHHGQALHEAERGAGSWASVLKGIDWLVETGARLAIAGRNCWNETLDEARAGYARLFVEKGWPVDVHDGKALVLLPEMDGATTVPEITTRCWSILRKDPADMMCATSRMVVKRKGAQRPTVLPCTLLPYQAAFDMGATLADAGRANGGMFDHGAVKLCHPHCAKFCVLGGGSCSGS